MDIQSIVIRNAGSSDFSAICRLSSELGYVNSKGEIRQRLNHILVQEDQAVFAAVLPDDRVIGWVHLFEAQRIESGKFAEIGGLIVAEAYRGIGVGTKLLRACETWACQRHLSKLRVRSRRERHGAAGFYSRMDFKMVKEQRVFDKMIGSTID